MYLVRNTSTQEIALGDLRIALKPGQQIDLDMICSRYVAEQSPSLKVFLKKGMLRIASKDVPNVIKEVHEVRVVAAPQNNEEILREMREQEKRLFDRQEALIRKHLADPSKGGMDPKALEALQTAIAALQGLAAGGTVAKAPQRMEPQEGLEEGTAVEIQKRTVDRLSKNAKGTIRHEESKAASNVDKNIDELGNLLQ